MKKIVIIVTLMLLVLVIVVVGINAKIKTEKVKKIQNEPYEVYLNGEIYGTDVITLINKAMNSNKSNLVSKDTRGYYINNDTNSILIDIEFITNSEENKTTVYKMEQISKLGTEEFIRNFNEAKFICSEKKYHLDTGKISYIKLTHVSE